MLRAGARHGALVWAGLFSALVGCTHLGPAERQVLIQASELYGRNETCAAISRLDRLIGGFGDAVEIAEAYYLRGLCRARRGELGPAGADFEEAIDKNKSKRDDLAARCWASLGALAYRRGNWDEAAVRYEKAVRHLPDQPPTDEVLYYAGVAMQRAGWWEEAAEQFGRILNKHRHRPIAAEARRLAAWQHDYFAVQLGAFQDAKQAEQAERSFRATSLDAVRLENHPRGGYAMWVVLAGRYPTYADASVGLRRARAVQSDAFIIPRP